MGRKLHSIRDSLVDWNIDQHLNRFILPNPLHHFPRPIAHFLGHRRETRKEPPTIIQWPVSFLATVAALCLVGGIGNYAPGITKYHPPVMIASLGASAILDFAAIASPLAQPRNSIIGNTLAALCGVAIAKLFQLNSSFNEIQWVSGAVGCACAGLIMSITGTVHPPGGATAVLASTQKQVIALGWPYVGIVMLDSTLLVLVALLFNNVFRRYPQYWWTPGTVGKKIAEEKKREKVAEEAQSQHSDDKDDDLEKGGRQEGKATSDTSSDRTLRREGSNGGNVQFVEGLEDVHIKPFMIQLPQHAKLSSEEVLVLESIQERLRTRAVAN